MVLVVKNTLANAGDMRSVFGPWVGKLPWKGNGNPLQYSCLESPTNKAALQATSMGSKRVRHNSGNFGFMCCAYLLSHVRILCDPMCYTLPSSSVHGDSPGKNSGVGYHALLQGVFPTQGSHPGLPHCRQILNLLSQQGSPRILDWVPSAFSRRTSPARKWTGVSCIAGEFFTSWATQEAWVYRITYKICQYIHLST